MKSLFVISCFVALNLAIHAPVVAVNPYAVPCRRGRKTSWKNVSVSSSGSTELKHASGGSSLTSNKKVENLLMDDKARGKTVNHYKKVEKSRMIGDDVTSLETNGNSEIDVGSPALLRRSRRSRRQHHHHGLNWGYGGYGGYAGYAGHSHYGGYRSGYGRTHAAVLPQVGSNVWLGDSE